MGLLLQLPCMEGRPSEEVALQPNSWVLWGSIAWGQQEPWGAVNQNRPSDSSPLSGAGLVVAALLGSSYRYFIPPLFLKGKEHFPVLGNWGMRKLRLRNGAQLFLWPPSKSVTAWGFEPGCFCLQRLSSQSLDHSSVNHSYMRAFVQELCALLTHYV